MRRLTLEQLQDRLETLEREKVTRAIVRDDIRRAMTSEAAPVEGTSALGRTFSRAFLLMGG